MAHYKPDFKLAEAEEVLKNLSETPENELIRYLVRKRDEHIAEQRKKIDEYQKVFDGIARFTNKNVIYG